MEKGISFCYFVITYSRSNNVSFQSHASFHKYCPICSKLIFLLHILFQPCVLQRLQFFMNRRINIDRISRNKIIFELKFKLNVEHIMKKMTQRNHSKSRIIIDKIDKNIILLLFNLQFWLIQITSCHYHLILN